MAQKNSFTHINIIPDDDEDTVIQVGISQSDDVADASSQPPAKSAKKRADSYQETTLADLSGNKMSVMQKSVIAVVVLFLVGFVIWYFLH